MNQPHNPWRVLTGTLANDDVTTRLGGDSGPPPRTDGGQSNLVAATLQNPFGDRPGQAWVVSASHTIYSNHNHLLSDGTRVRGEGRANFGSFALQATAVHPMQDGGFVATGGTVSYNETQLTSRAQSWVHERAGGTEVRSMYTGEGVRHGMQASLHGTYDRPLAQGSHGGVDWQVKAIAAAEAGTDRAAVATALGARFGRNPQALPTTIHAANPEGFQQPYVAAPGSARAGDWAVEMRAGAHYVPKNHAVGEAPSRAAMVGAQVLASVALTSRVTLGADAAIATNPTPDHGLPQRPWNDRSDSPHNARVGVSASVRF